MATSFGVVAALAPWATFNLALVYVLALTQTRIFSLSALSGRLAAAPGHGPVLRFQGLSAFGRRPLRTDPVLSPAKPGTTF